MDKEFRKALSMTYQIVLIFVLFFIAFTFGAVITEKVEAVMRHMMTDQMLSVSNTAASLIDGDDLRDVTPEDKGTPKYDNIMLTLSHFQENAKLAYIYCVRPEEDGSFTYTLDPAPENPAEFGAEATLTEALAEAAEGSAAVDETPYRNEWGRFYSSYSPVKDSSGKIVGIVAADFDADWYDEKLNSISQVAFLIGAMSMLVGAVMVVIYNLTTRRQLRRVRVQMTELAGNINDLMNEIAVPDHETGTHELKIDIEDYGDDVDSFGDMILQMQDELHDKIDMVREQAYLDRMTSVHNKSAYMDKVEELEEAMRESSASFAIAVFDLNSLKEINDSYGHSCGDAALKDAALVLSETFGCDNVFRIGGDEFIAVIDDYTQEQMVDLFEELDRRVEQVNSVDRLYRMDLGISKGYAVYDPAKHKEYNDAFRDADFMMYDDKAAYYQRIGDRRRRFSRKT